MTSSTNLICTISGRQVHRRYAAPAASENRRTYRRSVHALNTARARRWPTQEHRAIC